MTERVRERNRSWEIYQESLRFRTKRLESLENSKIHVKASRLEEQKPSKIVRANSEEG